MEDNKDLENSKVTEVKKKDSFFVVIIVILFMVIAGLCGFILIDFLDADKNNVAEKNDVDKDVSDNNDGTDVVTKVEVTDLNSIRQHLEKFMTALGDCSDEAANYFTTKKVVAADISNELALKTTAFAFLDQKVSISAEDFSKKVAEYFGKDYVYQHFTYNDCINHVYNANSNSYEYVETACGCTTGPNASIKYNIASAYYEGDLLVLNLKVLFPSKEYKDGEYHKYYSDAARTKEIAGLVYSEVEDGWILGARPLDIDDNFAKGGNYKFVLKKVTDGIYSFVSSEPVA